jgi:hypothetical protein
MKHRRPRVPRAWDPVLLERHEISALKALTPHAVAAIEKITAVDRASFAAGGEDGRRETDFAEGKRWVGVTLRNVRAMKMPWASGEQP